MEILTDKDLDEARRQAPPVRIDGIGVDTSRPENGVWLVLRKASTGRMEIYGADAESMVNTLRAAVKKLESSIWRGFASVRQGMWCRCWERGHLARLNIAGLRPAAGE